MFLSTDPVQGIMGGSSIRYNPYAYAGANPTSYVDPSGQCFTDPASAAACLWFATEVVGAGALLAWGINEYYQNIPEDAQWYHLGDRLNRSVSNFIADNSIKDLLRIAGFPAIHLPNPPAIFVGEPPFDFRIPGFQSMPLDPLIERLIPPYLPPMQESFPAGEPLSIRDLIFLSGVQDGQGYADPLVRVYRFADRTQLETLLPRSAKNPPFIHRFYNSVRILISGLQGRADFHAAGEVFGSPFVSALLDLEQGIKSSDEWIQAIIYGPNHMYPNIVAAPDIGVFDVPSSRLYYPRELLSINETEVLFYGEDLADYLVEWRTNPYIGRTP